MYQELGVTIVLDKPFYFIRDLNREMALAEVFADRDDLIEAAYHNTLRDIEMTLMTRCLSLTVLQ